MYLSPLEFTVMLIVGVPLLFSTTLAIIVIVKDIKWDMAMEKKIRENERYVLRDAIADYKAVRLTAQVEAEQREKGL